MTHSWYFWDSTLNVVGILIRNVASICVRTRLKRQVLLLVVRLFLMCVSFGKLHVYVLFLANTFPPPNNPVRFLLCLFIICKYGRAGKYIKSSCPKCLTEKTAIFAVPMILWIDFFLTYAFHQSSFLYPCSFKNKPPKLLEATKAMVSCPQFPLLWLNSGHFNVLCLDPWEV